MSNKMTIKRAPEPVKRIRKEEKKPRSPKNRRKLAGMIPAIIFIAVAIWYFISSRH